MTTPDDANTVAGGSPVDLGVGRLEPARAMHKRLSSARGLLIEWRNTLRRGGFADESERAGFERELARFDDAIKALAVARDKYRATACGCAACDRAVNLFPSRMSLCPRCGDKRCPRAENHRNKCSKTPNGPLQRPVLRSAASGG